MTGAGYMELLKLVAPESIMVLTVLGVLAADLWGLRGEELPFRRSMGAIISCSGCAGAIGWMLVAPQQANFAEGILVVDPLTQLVKVALLVLTVCAILITVDTDFTPHTGEYFALILLAAVGMMFLVSSEDILMIFISLELTSLSLYILTAFNKRQAKSAEAALKYFLFGGMAAAFTLFGLSLLYGFSGSTSLGGIADAIKGPRLDPLLVAAIVMTLIGFGFKVAAVPFHLWAPDVYEGAPAPSAAFIASGSKVAGLVVLAKVVMIGFKGAEGSAAWHGYLPGWVPVLAVLAGASMVVGNLAAIAQTSVRRLLAYSAIAHAGYMLLGVLGHDGQSLAALIYYVITYALTTLGAFGVVAVVQERVGGDRLSDFAGLSRRAPFLSFCMLVFMLSLAGIPPLAGFFGKFYVFAAALNSDPKNLGLLWLVIVALGMSAVSLYYYLRVLKQIYVAEPAADAIPVRASVLSRVFLALLSLAVVVLGCAPNLLIDKLVQAIRLAGF
ncbi:MAG: NADH-quinone oxidoreductase subunit N [Verrucomicrobiota bacterium]